LPESFDDPLLAPTDYQSVVANSPFLTFIAFDHCTK
jgi:hypothetical protein